MTQTTLELAKFVTSTHADNLPANVRQDATRQFHNFVGCTLGGMTHDATVRTFKTVLPFTGGAKTALIGRKEKLSAPDAVLVNAQASAAHAFDDTHLSTVLHPAGPIAAPLMAEAERQIISGQNLQLAFTIGVEVACRIGMALTVPPAETQVGWYMSSVATPIGAAAALANLLKFDEEQTLHALGLAANAAMGFRETHGSMCTSLLPAQASRAGYMAALLAAEGVTATGASLEGPKGFGKVFAPKAHLEHVTAELGTRWEMRDNMPKPYPCGIVIHPILDACLDISNDPNFTAREIDNILLRLNPLCLTLTDRPEPPDAQLAQVSLQHWSAVALVRKAASIAEGSAEAVSNPEVIAARRKIQVQPDNAVNRDGADVTIKMINGKVYHRRIEHGIGSLKQPMSNEALESKFINQAKLVLSDQKSQKLSNLCWQLEDLDDAALIMRNAQP